MLRFGERVKARFFIAEIVGFLWGYGNPTKTLMPNVCFFRKFA